MMSILLIEDNEILIKIMKHFLKEYKIYKAQNVKEAFYNVMKHTEIIYVFCDIMLDCSDKTGGEISKMLKIGFPRLKICFLTAMDEESGRRYYRKYKDYVETIFYKPVNRKMIEEFIKNN